MNIARPLLMLILCLLLSLSALAQETDFIDVKARYAIKVPRRPVEEALAFTLLKYEISGTSALWKDDEGNYVEVRNLLATGEKLTLSQTDKKAVLTSFKAGYVRDLQKAGLTVRELPYIFDGFDGVEIQATGAGGKLVSRLFFAHARFYVISATKEHAETFDSPLAILNTFRILNKEEYSAKLVEENSPRSFPQKAAIPRPASDIQQAAMKGRVKSVITEHQLPQTSTRERAREQYFNSSGDLEKEIFYSTNGYPTDVFTWGWVDGMRVSDNKFIDYEADEGPNENGITNLVMSLDMSPNAKPVRKADERFSNRYEYSYGPSGKLLEEKTFDNTGEMSQRIVRRYGAGRNETIDYDADGSINTKTVETLDPSEHVIEEKRFDNKGKLYIWYVYKLEFDTMGNWIVRRTYEKKFSNRRPVQKQIDTEYRKIDYF